MRVIVKWKYYGKVKEKNKERSELIGYGYWVYLEGSKGGEVGDSFILIFGF